jgi:cytochrome P450
MAAAHDLSLSDLSLDELIGRFSPGDPAFTQWPYPVLDALREATPVFRWEPGGVWMVTRFDLVHELLRDRRLGRQYTHRYSHEAFGRPEPDPRWQPFRDHDRWSLLELEPPDHTRIRRLITKVFTPRAVEALRPDIEARAAATLAPLVERGSFDLVTDYAQPFSIGVICSMLGVPEDDAQQLLDWSHSIVKMYEPAGTDAMRQEATDAAAGFTAYAYDLIARKRSAPDGKLVSDLAGVEDEGERLTDAEIMSTTIVLLNAGHEATVNGLCNGMRALMLHRDEWRRLTSGEVTPRTGVEELLRWDPPLQIFERYVLDEGVEIPGHRLAVGEQVGLLFGAANRDPRKFADAGRFDIGRGDTTHVEFGGGIHFCIGAPLARLELEVSLAELVRRCPDVAMTATPAYTGAFAIRGLTGLPLASTG